MGPDAEVILPRAMTEADRATLTGLIASRATFQSADRFTITAPPSAEGPDSGERLYFEISISKASGDEDATETTVGFRRWFQDEFGFEPVQGVVFFAARSGEAYHRVLAELCLAVAEEFGGIVSFGGALEPRRYDTYSIEAEWSTVAPYSDAMLAGMPGTLVARPYQTGRDTTWVAHYGDATFLRAWMKHPLFHMIK
jgi:hypothetical protein